MKKTHIIFQFGLKINLGPDPNPHSAESMDLNPDRIRIHNTGQSAYKQGNTYLINTNFKLEANLSNN